MAADIQASTSLSYSGMPTEFTRGAYLNSIFVDTPSCLALCEVANNLSKSSGHGIQVSANEDEVATR